MPLAEFAEAAGLNRFSGAEAFAWHRNLIDARESAYDARVAKRIRLGATMSAADYIDLHRGRRDWIARMERAIAPFDALVMPTVPVVAPPIAELEASEETFFRLNALLLRNPSVFNLLDGCAVSIPCHDPGTLPVGLTIGGGAMTDARVLAIARAAESVLNGAR